jgi:hypothetical protein
LDLEANMLSSTIHASCVVTAPMMVAMTSSVTVAKKPPLQEN